MITVSNASPLIALSRINQLQILKQLFSKVYVPKSVYIETVTNSTNTKQSNAIKHSINDYIEIVSPNRQIKCNRQLSSGEIDVLRVALEHNIKVVLIDDKKARREAQEFGLIPVFTSNLLMQSEKQGFIESYQLAVRELSKIQIYLPE